MTESRNLGDASPIVNIQLPDLQAELAADKASFKVDPANAVLLNVYAAVPIGFKEGYRGSLGTPVMHLSSYETMHELFRGYEAMAKAKGLDPETTFHDWLFVSTLSDPIGGEDGSYLFKIDDEGKAFDTAVMRDSVLPQIRTYDRPLWLVLDQIDDFISFNPYSRRAWREVKRLFVELSKLNGGDALGGLIIPRVGILQNAAAEPAVW